MVEKTKRVTEKMCKKMKCPVCSSNKTNMFFKRSNIPVHQNIIFKDKETAIKADRGDLILYMCSDCSFIYNKDFDNNKLRYGELYDNTQDLSTFFDSYIERQISYLINELGIKNKRIVEVGCGKGTFLKKLVSASGSIGYGFDPSYVGEKSVLNGKVKFYKNFYDDKCTDIHADIVICRHVIEHIPEPIELLQNIRKALINSSNAIVFLETPNVNWILENKVIYDFFYEHCSYFNKMSMAKALYIAGYDVQTIKHEFNNQYIWVVATIKDLKDESNSKFKIQGDTSIFRNRASDFLKEETMIIEKWKNNINLLNKDGKVAIWGAGAKGVTFINSIDSFSELIDCAIDINTNKQGKYLPGTGHPIVSFKDIPIREVQSAIIMNSNYKYEIESLLSEENIDINLIDWEA